MGNDIAKESKFLNMNVVLHLRRVPGVYAFIDRDTNLIFYVGATKDLYKRLAERHERDFLTRNHDYLQDIWDKNKKGIEIIFLLIKDQLEKKELEEIESEWIAFLRTDVKRHGWTVRNQIISNREAFNKGVREEEEHMIKKITSNSIGKFLTHVKRRDEFEYELEYGLGEDSNLVSKVEWFDFSKTTGIFLLENGKNFILELKHVKKAVNPWIFKKITFWLTNKTDPLPLHVSLYAKPKNRVPTII